MKLRIITIGIICMLLITGLTVVTAAKTEEVEKIKGASQNEDLPDLIVTDIWIETKFNGNEGFRDLYIHATVKNIGNAPAKTTEPGHPDWFTAFYVNERKLFDSRWINTLNPGESRYLTCLERDFPIVPFIKCKIRVYTDWTNHVIESNDDNNNKTITQPISRNHYRNPLFFNQNLIQNLFYLRIIGSNFIKLLYQRFENFK